MSSTPPPIRPSRDDAPWIRWVESELLGQRVNIKNASKRATAAQQQARSAQDQAASQEEAVVSTTLTAAKPGNLTLVSNVGGWNLDGTVFSTIILEWEHVGTAVTGEVVPAVEYEVWQSTGDVRTRVTAVKTPRAVFQVPAGEAYDFTVRARTGNGPWGEYSDPLEVIAATPALQLDAPSKPTLASGGGVVIVTWDGLLGGLPPPAWLSRVVAQRQDGVGWVTVGSLRDGSISDAGLTRGVEHTYRLVAVDVLGRESDPSATESIVVAGVVEADLDEAIMDAIDGAVQDAEDALEAANGKNKIIFSEDPASGTTGFVAGDVWFQTDDDLIIAQWEFTTAWEQRTLDNAVIANLDAGKITTGFLAAARLAARSIEVSKLVVADTSNMAVDPLVDEAFGVNWTGTGAERASVANSVSSLNAIRNSGSGSSHWESVGFIPVEPGASYHLSAEMHRETAGSNSLGIQFYTDAKATVGSVEYVVTGNTGSWARLGDLVEAPSTAAYAKIVGDGTGASGSGNHFWTGMVLRRAMTGELVVDGAILARHVTMDEGFADKFWANEGNFNKITVNMVEPNFGESLNLSGNGEIILMANRVEATEDALGEPGDGSTPGTGIYGEIEDVNSAVGAVADGLTNVNTVATGAAEAAATADAKAQAARDLAEQHSVGLRVLPDYVEVGREGEDSVVRISPTEVTIGTVEAATTRWNGGQMQVPEIIADKSRLGNLAIEAYGNDTVFKVVV